jgi:hypothetical protein
MSICDISTTILSKKDTASSTAFCCIKTAALFSSGTIIISQRTAAIILSPYGKVFYRYVSAFAWIKAVYKA